MGRARRRTREAEGPKCPLHVGTVMVRRVQGSSLIRYGYQARKPEKHYRCPLGGCPSVAMAENPSSNELIRGRAGRPGRMREKPADGADDGRRDEFPL